MPLTILSNKDVRKILHSLTSEDVRNMQQHMGRALHDYSTGTQESTAGCSSNQPQRIAIASKDSTTLFMPAQIRTSTGIKIVSLATPRHEATPPQTQPPTPRAESTQVLPHRNPSTASTSTSGDTSTTSSLTTLTSSTTSISTKSTTASNSPASSKPSISISTSASGEARSSSPHIATPARTTTPRGCLALLDPNTGLPTAFINATDLTAFRTALASTIIFNKRKRVHSIAVFGAGRQAYWHIRVALLLRGQDIHHVRIINRTFAGAEPLLQSIYLEPDWSELRSQGSKKLDFSILSKDYGEYDRVLKERVRDADAIFCCTPSTSPLFPGEFLTSSEGRKKGRYLGLIGSYRPHMHEVHPDILVQAVKPHEGKHHHRHAERGGVVVVDGLEACLKEAGEVIKAGLSPEELVELGEIIMVKKAARMEIEMGIGKGEEGLQRWLESGDVIYKSVGLGLMDLVVGEEMVRLAGEMGIGVRVEDF